MKLISYFYVVFFFPGLGGGRPQVRLSGGVLFCLIAIFTVLMLDVAFDHSPQDPWWTVKAASEYNYSPNWAFSHYNVG